MSRLILSHQLVRQNRLLRFLPSALLYQLLLYLRWDPQFLLLPLTRSVPRLLLRRYRFLPLLRLGQESLLLPWLR